MQRAWPWLVAIFMVVVAVAPPHAGARAGARSRLTAHDERVNALIAGMTLDEKIGQMTQADQQFAKDEADVATYHLGSVLSGGDSDPKTNSFEDWRAVYERFQAQTAKTRLKIPLLYGVDAVHGHNNVVGAVIFPHNVGL